MNRVEFMRKLERLLSDIPENDRLDAITYYNNYFDEAGAENEAQVIRELGSPKKVAENIKAGKKRNIPIVLVIILVILASPVLVGIGGGLLGVLVGIFGALFGILVAVIACGAAFLVAGVVCIVAGIVRIALSPAEGLVTIGVGSILLALGILFLILLIWCIFKWVPALFRGCVNLCQRLFHRGERRSKA